MITKFKTSHLIKNKWIDQIICYKGDLSNIDLSIDWRFCNIQNKRKQASLIN